jgi:hypothetical protein
MKPHDDSSGGAKMFVRLLLLLLSMVIAQGCATNPRIEDLQPSQRAKAGKIEISHGPIDRPHSILGTVSGLSCNRNKYQAQDISDREALEGVKIKASMMDADAVINTFCQKNSDTDWRNNCWASVKCVGEAIRYQN